MHVSKKYSVVAVAVAALAGNAFALNWSGDTSSTWDTSTANWSGLPPVVWTNGSAAAFNEGTAANRRAITIAAPGVTASGVTFNLLSDLSKDKYSIGAASGSPAPALTLSGLATLTANENATITAPLSFSSQGAPVNWTVNAGKTLTIGAIGGQGRVINLNNGADGGGTLKVTGAVPASQFNLLGTTTLELAGGSVQTVNVNMDTALEGTGAVTGSLNMNYGGVTSPGTGDGMGVITAGLLSVGGGTYSVDLSESSSDLISAGGVDQFSSLFLDLDLSFTPTVQQSGSFHQWTIAQSTNGGFKPTDPGQGWYVISGVSNDIASYFSLSLVPFGAQGQSLVLTYNAVPEATTMILGGMAVMPLILHRRRNRRVA